MKQTRRSGFGRISVGAWQGLTVAMMVVVTTSAWASKESRSPGAMKAAPSVSSESATAVSPAQVPWDDLGESDGVHVWSKSIPGSGFVAFRGETVIPSSLAKIAQVLSDTPRKLEWIHGAEVAKDLPPIDPKAPVNPFERIEYNRTDSGIFIVADRDFVYKAWIEFDVPQKTLVIRVKSVEHPLMPPTDAVRGEVQSVYVLKVLSPTQTRVMVEVHADPKGMLPKVLVNLFQKNWPSKTLAGIRTQAARDDVPEMVTVKEIFDGKFLGYLPSIAHPEELFVRTGNGSTDTLSSSVSSATKPAPLQVADGPANGVAPASSSKN